MAEGCGVCQLFKNKVHGYKVVNWATLDDIIDIVERLLEGEWLKMGKAARRHVINQGLTWRKHVENLSETLKRYGLIKDELLLEPYNQET